MRTVRAIFVGVLALLLLGSATAFAGSPTTVVATRNYEFHGSGNADYFAWTFARNGHRELIIKVKPTGGSVVTINKRGRWQSGSMDQTGSLLPYWRITGKGSNRDMDIHVYDMAANDEAAVPANVNTNKLEYFPAISGNQMTFVRAGSSTQTLWLVTDRSTGAKLAVATLDRSRAIVANAPNLMGNWVTYAVCRRTGCEAYRYDIGLATTTRVPNPQNKYYFAPSADLAGNVYLERSGAGCGASAKLMKWAGSGNPSTFYSFNSGHDMIGTSVYDDGAGSVTLYVDTYGCATGSRDIVSFSNP
jgi:hypothetical protein